MKSPSPEGRTKSGGDPVDPGVGDFLDQLEGKLRRRNERMRLRLIAWAELLDATGWCVALDLPADELWLSDRAKRDLESRASIPASWYGLTALVDILPRDHCGLDRAGVKIWASQSLARPETPVGLTRRETEILDWLRQGKTGPEIAIIVGCAPRTVEKHLANLYKKLGVRNRAAVILSSARQAGAE